MWSGGKNRPRATHEHEELSQQTNHHLTTTRSANHHRDESARSARQCIETQFPLHNCCTSPFCHTSVHLFFSGDVVHERINSPKLLGSNFDGQTGAHALPTFQNSEGCCVGENCRRNKLLQDSFAREENWNRVRSFLIVFIPLLQRGCGAAASGGAV